MKLPGTPDPKPTVSVKTVSHWRDVVEMARNAPLADAIVALQIIATRIEDELL